LNLEEALCLSLVVNNQVVLAGCIEVSPFLKYRDFLALTVPNDSPNVEGAA
jgi:hypothetical protein